MSATWTQLAAGVFQARLAFLDVTVGMVHTGTDVLVIDCGTTRSEAVGIAADIRAMTGRTVTQVVLTHHHFDHILGVSVFADATMWAAPEVAATIAERTDWLRRDALHHGADPAAVDVAIAALRAPDHLTRDATIHLGRRRVQVHHLGRGHTDHDLVVVVPPLGEADPTVVFCGDLVEESGPPAVGPDADPACWPGTLDRLLAVGGPHACYVPGHGAPVTADFVRAQRDRLAAGGAR